MSNNYEKQYLNILKEILAKGKLSSNRTGIKTYKLWGQQMHIDLQEGFPALTTKKLHWKSVVHELLWMISGSTNIQYLLKNGVTFWSEWPYQIYKEYWEKNGCSITGEGKLIGNDIGARSYAIYSLKEFEQRIINDDVFAKRWGSIGEHGYGALWRKFPYHFYEIVEDRFVPDWIDSIGYVDQLINVINELKSNPDSRRIIISAWHPYHSNRKEDALLPACHNYVQFGTEELTVDERYEFYIKNGGKYGWTSVTEMNKKVLEDTNTPKYRLNCYYSMRSNDFFLGNPYNNAFYALFTHLIANQLNMIPGQLVYSAADVHSYENHVEQAKLQLTRKAKELPKLIIKTPGKSIFDIKFEDLELTNYNPEPNIKAEVAI